MESGADWWIIVLRIEPGWRPLPSCALIPVLSSYESSNLTMECTFVQRFALMLKLLELLPLDNDHYLKSLRSCVVCQMSAMAMLRQKINSDNLSPVGSLWSSKVNAPPSTEDGAARGCYGAKQLSSTQKTSICAPNCLSRNFFRIVTEFRNKSTGCQYSCSILYQFVLFYEWLCITLGTKNTLHPITIGGLLEEWCLLNPTQRSERGLNAHWKSEYI